MQHGSQDNSWCVRSHVKTQDKPAGRVLDISIEACSGELGFDMPSRSPDLQLRSVALYKNNLALHQRAANISPLEDAGQQEAGSASSEEALRRS